MRANALAQVILVRIYIALVQTTDYIVNVLVVYIKRMESKSTRSRAVPLRQVVIYLTLVRVQCSLPEDVMSELDTITLRVNKSEGVTCWRDSST